MNFNTLINQIDQTHLALQQNAVKAINSHITLRNWLIGLYIVEFEQNGEDRAKYGTQLLKELANSLKIKGLGETNLKQCRTFFQIYPEISQSLTDIFSNVPLIIENKISQALTDELVLNEISAKNEMKFESITTKNSYYKQIFTQISYTHFVELIKIKEPIKRKFYE